MESVGWVHGGCAAAVGRARGARGTKQAKQAEVAPASNRCGAGRAAHDRSDRKPGAVRMNPKWRPYQKGSNGSPTGLDPARRGPAGGSPARWGRVRGGRPTTGLRPEGNPAAHETRQG